MKKASARVDDPDMLPEYEVPKHATRGKYAARFKAKTGCYLVSVDLALREYFPDDAAVNGALLMVAQAAERAGSIRSRRKTA